MCAKTLKKNWKKTKVRRPTRWINKMSVTLEKTEFQLPKRLRGLQPTLIRQFFERALPDSINFGLGEPDLPTPQFLREEAARVTLEEQNGYTSHPGIPALRQKIAEQ